MSQTVVLIWLVTAQAGPLSLADAPRSERAQLSHWAAAENVRLAGPPSSAQPVRFSYDVGLVQSIEAWLDQARSAAGALEESSALELLSQVETAVLEHPELPQAAWLMAEHHHVLADLRAASPEPDGEAAALALRARAEALEGARGPTFSEQDEAATPARPALETFAVSVDGLAAKDALEWNGVPSGTELRASAGTHHVRVLRGGRLVFAAWTTVQGAGPLSLDVPPIVPCSFDDLDGARIDNGRAVAPGGARCPSWAVARAAPGGAIDIARCSGGRCGALVRFRQPEPRPKPLVSEEKSWPGWATYTLAGVGAALATGLVLWQTGAFERPEPETRTTWEFRGLGSTAFRF